MGLFAALYSQKSQPDTPSVVRNLSKTERLAVTVAMHLVVNRYGNRRVYPQEINYMQAIQMRVLQLRENEVAAMRVATFNPFSILQAMPQELKQYFATVFYRLATLMKDPAVLGRASVVIRELGLSMTELATPTAFPGQG